MAEVERAARLAELAVVQSWPQPAWRAVQDQRPEDVTDAWDWAATVQMLRKPWETPADAAERVVRLRVAMAERYDAMPSLRALQEGASR